MDAPENAKQTALKIAPYNVSFESSFKRIEFPSLKFLEVSFGTWNGTEQSGTRRSVPHLVRLKRVERAVPRDEASLLPLRSVPFRPVPSRLHTKRYLSAASMGYHLNEVGMTITVTDLF
ncbi:S ribonuclease [Pyrus ussuriensis x Pyrus communis]|uniref:S ribonuclease n=1 Tax=Pyrus ussuriensis x Pyrus communis TaxID=2448454 RepID=A0A5N5I141_9ROSA|nr:S ribonuclease [Pyrus ussuriensis x Pyrus communis]